MSIKILGGVAKGVELSTPSSLQTRPTSVMLKRRLFDSTQDFSGLVFVDLFAGTGSIGLEALSRGAYEVLFIEKSLPAIKVINQNINKFTKFTELGNAQVFKQDVLKWLTQFLLKSDGYRNYILFVDPPYEEIKLYDEIVEKLKNSSFDGRVIIEACEQKTIKLKDFEIKYFVPDKVFKQGTSFFAVYDFS